MGLPQDRLTTKENDVITDRRHAENIRQAMHRASDALLDLWVTEQHAASAPRSGPAVAVTSSATSDPTGSIAADQTREKGLNALGVRITKLLEALEREVTLNSPRKAEEIDKCFVCMLWPGSGRDGRCTFCGGFYRTHKRDRTLKMAREHHKNLTETRPCKYDGCETELLVVRGAHWCTRHQKQREREQASVA
jgi:hypothetical protein